MFFKQTAKTSQGDHQVGRTPRPTGAPSILSVDLKIEGDIVTEGEIHINGSVKGDVVARKLTLGEGGSITGTVEADLAVIAGNLAGRLTATSVVLESTARVVADVTHVSMSVEPGAVFEGFSRRVETIEAAMDESGRIQHQPRIAAPARGEAQSRTA
jgi:cytoskeletal protein CcmA (bactofilin family)